MMIKDMKSEAISANTVSAQNQLPKDQYVTNLTAGTSDNTHSNKSGIRILFVGNSITRHAPKEDIGWYDDWGMAASTLEKDYVHLVMGKVHKLHADAKFCIAQAAEWERNFWRLPEIAGNYRSAVEFSPNIIIMRIAENVKRDSVSQHPFASCYEQFIDFFNPDKKARVILTTSFWVHGPVDEAIRSVSAKQGYPLVELGALGEKNEMKAIGLFEHTGVAAHPGDLGMAAIADAIWKPLQSLLAGM